MLYLFKCKNLNVEISNDKDELAELIEEGDFLVSVNNLANLKNIIWWKRVQNINPNPYSLLNYSGYEYKDLPDWVKLNLLLILNM